MNDITVYRPYQFHARVFPFTAFISLLALVATGYCIPYWKATFLLATIGVGGAWLTKYLSDTTKVVVVFEQQGVRILGDKHHNYRFVPWENLTYAYYTRNYKGHPFLVLTPNALDRKEAKHFANRGANTTRICIDGVLVIYMDIIQDVSPIEELIATHVEHVVTYQ